MSQTTQDGTPRSQATTSENAPRATQPKLPTESTPAKKKYGPDLPYTSAAQPFDEVRERLGKEMHGRWLGAMPVDAFLERYLPGAREPLPDLPKDPFKNVPSDGIESKRYDRFITAIAEWMPSLLAVNTSNKADTENKVNLKPDISIYNRVEDMIPPIKTDFSRMELWMEFKANSNGAAFIDPKDEKGTATKESGSFTPVTKDGNMARGQLAHYAGAQHSLQFRHFSFSVVVHGDEARFLRWDPSGTVVTTASNFRENPRSMAEFFWRFDHLSPKERGHDISVQPANLVPEDDARVRAKLGIKEHTLLYMYELPGMLLGKGHAYGPRPSTENRSLVSRCTRNLPVVWIPNEDTNRNNGVCDLNSSSTIEEKRNLSRWSKERLIYMKDTWRFLSNLPGVTTMPEHEIYEILHGHKTPNIPEDVTGGDVEGGKTQTEELLDAEWLCVKQRVSQYQHYRLVHGVVGRPLFRFECTKQLVTAVFDALLAHSHAFDSAKLLHRDVSMGNIILTDEGKGLLIDWEMAKMVDESGSRRPDRTGTWQFISANLLQSPGKTHTLTDDLESFLHVLAWTMLRYVPAVDDYTAVLRGEEMINMFDRLYREQDHSERGGYQKRLSLLAGEYPSLFFQPKYKTPILKVVQELSKPFKSFYRNPPTDEDRKRIRGGPNSSDSDLYLLWHTISAYDTAIGRLQSSTWFIDVIKKALDEEVWPTDDEGVKLSIVFEGETQHQQAIRTSRYLASHSVMERSKWVPRSSGSKRAASPTPEPSAKRRRGTPAASGSGI